MELDGGDVLCVLLPRERIPVSFFITMAAALAWFVSMWVEDWFLCVIWVMGRSLGPFAWRQSLEGSASARSVCEMALWLWLRSARFQGPRGCLLGGRGSVAAEHVAGGSSHLSRCKAKLESKRVAKSTRR